MRDTVKRGEMIGQMGMARDENRTPMTHVLLSIHWEYKHVEGSVPRLETKKCGCTLLGFDMMWEVDWAGFFPVVFKVITEVTNKSTNKN